MTEFYAWHAERGHAPEYTATGVSCGTCGEQFSDPARRTPEVISNGTES